MAIGAEYTFKLHSDSQGKAVFDSLKRVEFTHDSAFTTSRTFVTANDFPGTNQDGFTVQVSYPEGQEPDADTSFHDLFGLAVTAVADAITGGKLGGCSPMVAPTYE